MFDWHFVFVLALQWFALGQQAVVGVGAADKEQLAVLVAKFAPPPKRYHMVWNQVRGLCY